MAAPKQASQSWVELSSEDDVSASTCLPSGDSDSPAQKASSSKPQWADIEDSDHEGEHHHSEEKQQRWSDVPCDEAQNGGEVKNDGWAVVGKKPKQASKQVQDYKDVTGKPAEQQRRAGREFAEAASRAGSKGQQGASQASQDGKQWGSTKANGLASPEVSKQWGQKASSTPKQDSSWGAKASQPSSQDAGKQWGKASPSQDSGKVWGKANGVSSQDAGKWGAKDAKPSSPSHAQSPSHRSGNDGWGRAGQERGSWSRTDSTPTSRANAEAWNSKSRKDNTWGSAPRGGAAGSERNGRSSGQTRMDSARLNW